MGTYSLVGALLFFRFPPNFCDSSILDSIEWNRTKFCMQYTNFARWHWFNFCTHSLIGGAVVTIFQEFSGKCRSWVQLNETAQKFICKINIIRNDKFIFFSWKSYRILIVPLTLWIKSNFQVDIFFEINQKFASKHQNQSTNSIAISNFKKNSISIINTKYTVCKVSK